MRLWSVRLHVGTWYLLKDIQWISEWGILSTVHAFCLHYNEFGLGNGITPDNCCKWITNTNSVSEHASLQVIWSPFFRFLFIPLSPLRYRPMDILSEGQKALALTSLTEKRSYGYNPKQTVIFYISATRTFTAFLQTCWTISIHFPIKYLVFHNFTFFFAGGRGVM